MTQSKLAEIVRTADPHEVARLDEALRRELEAMRVLTLPQAEAVLQVSHNTLLRMVDRGEMPTLRVGRQLRIRQADLRAFIDNGSK